MRHVVVIMLFVGIVVIALLLWPGRPIDAQLAANLVQACSNQAERHCYAQGTLKLRDAAGAHFRLVRKDESLTAVSDYEFVSTDGRLCAFAQFGKGDFAAQYSADFYRCAEHKNVSLGVG